MQEKKQKKQLKHNQKDRGSPEDRRDQTKKKGSDAEWLNGSGTCEGHQTDQGDGSGGGGESQILEGPSRGLPMSSRASEVLTEN